MAQAQPKSTELYALQAKLLAAVGLPEFDFLYRQFNTKLPKIEHSEPSEYFYFRALQSAINGNLTELDRFSELAVMQDNSQEQRANLATSYMDLGLYCSAEKLLSPLYKIQGKSASIAGACAMAALLNGNLEQALVELENINAAYPEGKGIDSIIVNNLTQVNCILQEIVDNEISPTELARYQQAFEKLVREQVKPALKTMHASLTCAFPGVYPLISVEFNGVASHYSSEQAIKLSNLLSDETACVDVSSAVKMLFNADFNAVDFAGVTAKIA